MNTRYRWGSQTGYHHAGCGDGCEFREPGRADAGDHENKWAVRVRCDYVDKTNTITADGPEFRKMFDAASRREFDVVVFWSLDRFSREGVQEILEHLKVLAGHGCEWFSYREQYLRSIDPFRDAVLGILAAIANQERVGLSERVHAGLSRREPKARCLAGRKLQFGLRAS